MIYKLQQNVQPDTIGAFASSLCLVHCIATPFLFIAQSCSAVCCDSSPLWWQTIDILFIGISFFAVYWSTKTTSKSWLKFALWLSWSFLFAIILNEFLELLVLSEYVIYIPAIALVILHLYNKKYCQCKDNTCCNS